MSSIAVEFSVDVDNLDRAIEAMRDLKRVGAADAYRKFYQHFRTQTYQRYLRAAKETPFAPGSIGKRKPRSGRKIPDGYFGIDSGELFSEIVNNVRFNTTGFVIPTTKDYADFVMQKFEQKGPFSPESPIFIDEEDLDVLEEAISEVIERRIFGG